jgi:hypothetical protein
VIFVWIIICNVLQVIECISLIKNTVNVSITSYVIPWSGNVPWWWHTKLKRVL